MANYHTQFVVAIHSTTIAESEWLRDFFADETEDVDGNTATGGLELILDAGNMAYIQDSAGEGSMDKLAACLRAFLRAHRPADKFIVSWANTCDKHRVDAFSGGAVVVTARQEIWFNPEIMANDYPVCEPMVADYATTIDIINEAVNDKKVPARRRSKKR